MNTHRWIMHTTAALAAALVVGAWAPASAQDYSAELQRAANAANAHLPMMVGRVIRLDHAEAGPGNNLTYDYTVLTRAANAVDAQKVTPALRQAVRGDLCHNPKLLSVLNLGVIFHYVYRGNDGIEITEFALSAGDCDGES